MTRKVTILLFILTISINLIGQNAKLPKNLDECYAILDSIIPEVQKVEIRKSKNLDVMTSYHMSLGLYVRNNWIRHGSQLLIDQINYNHWKVGVDDLGGVILDGYWYHIHQLPYSWAESLESASKYYESYGTPDPLSNPEKKSLKKSNVTLMYEKGKYTEVIHVYKILNENNYYLYIKSKGWCKISENQFQSIKNYSNRAKMIDSFYVK